MSTLQKLNEYRERLVKFRESQSKNDPWGKEPQEPTPQEHQIKDGAGLYMAKVIREQVLGR